MGGGHPHPPIQRRDSTSSTSQGRSERDGAAVDFTMSSLPSSASASSAESNAAAAVAAATRSGGGRMGVLQLPPPPRRGSGGILHPSSSISSSAAWPTHRTDAGSAYTYYSSAGGSGSSSGEGAGAGAGGGLSRMPSFSDLSQLGWGIHLFDLRTGDAAVATAAQFPLYPGCTSALYDECSGSVLVGCEEGSILVYDVRGGRIRTRIPGVPTVALQHHGGGGGGHRSSRGGAPPPHHHSAGATPHATTALGGAGGSGHRRSVSAVTSAAAGTPVASTSPAGLDMDSPLPSANAAAAAMSAATFTTSLSSGRHSTGDASARSTLGGRAATTAGGTALSSDAANAAAAAAASSTASFGASAGGIGSGGGGVAWNRARSSSIGRAAASTAADWSLTPEGGGVDVGPAADDDDDAATDSCITVDDVYGHLGPVMHLASHPSRHCLASAGHDGDVKLWSLPGLHCSTLARVTSGMPSGVAVTGAGAADSGGADHQARPLSGWTTCGGVSGLLLTEEHVIASGWDGSVTALHQQW